jgi:hypothetical protein
MIKQVDTEDKVLVGADIGFTKFSGNKLPKFLTIYVSQKTGR